MPERMRPEEVPETLVDLAEDAYSSDLAWYGKNGRLRFALAAVLPEIRTQERARIVEDIRAITRNPDKLAAWSGARKLGAGAGVGAVLLAIALEIEAGGGRG